jgi:hypothetical protein
MGADTGPAPNALCAYKRTAWAEGNAQLKNSAINKEISL